MVLQDGMKGETLFVAVNILDRVASRQRIAGMQPKPYTLNPKPCTQHPNSKTRIPNPKSLNLKPPNQYPNP